jgi:hypothetical protein
MGAIANVTEEGFGPSGFHAWPSALRIDGYSGDYGPGFFGHAVNAATYVTRDEDLGWLAFGGNLMLEDSIVRVEPRDSARSRVYIAPLRLWLTLDAGKFEHIEINEDEVRVTLEQATPFTPVARLRLRQPAGVERVGLFAPRQGFAVERGAHVIPLLDRLVTVSLRRAR